jgi:hypothetical protein
MILWHDKTDGRAPPTEAHFLRAGMPAIFDNILKKPTIARSI